MKVIIVQLIYLKRRSKEIIENSSDIKIQSRERLIHFNDIDTIDTNRVKAVRKAVGPSKKAC